VQSRRRLVVFRTGAVLFEQLLGAVQEQPPPSIAPAIASEGRPGAGLNHRPCSEQAPGEPQGHGRRPKQARGPAEAIPSESQGLRDVTEKVTGAAGVKPESAYGSLLRDQNNRGGRPGAFRDPWLAHGVQADGLGVRSITKEQHNGRFEREQCPAIAVTAAASTACRTRATVARAELHARAGSATTASASSPPHSRSAQSPVRPILSALQTAARAASALFRMSIRRTRSGD